MGKHRKHYTPEEKVAISATPGGKKVRYPILCQEQKLQPRSFTGVEGVL